MTTSVKKHKKRYLIYKGKKYKIISKKSDYKIYKLLGKIISKLISSKRKRSRLLPNKESKSQQVKDLSFLPSVINTAHTSSAAQVGDMIFKQNQLESKLKHLEEGSKANPIDVDKIAIKKENKTIEQLKIINGFENFRSEIRYETIKKLYDEIIGGFLPPSRKGVSTKDMLFNDLINHDEKFADTVVSFSNDRPDADKQEIDEILNLYLKHNVYDQPLSPSNIKHESGTGLNDNQPGLYNFEVDKLMNKYKNKRFLGVYPIDELDKIMKPKHNHSSYSFILNNEPHNVRIGHFIAVMMKPGVLEYYDPLANKPKRQFIQNIINVMRKLDIKLPVQFKINKIRFQSSISDNCGYFSMRFLQRRYNGEDFKDASGYTRFMGIKDSERGIRKYRHNIEEFGTLQKGGSIVDQFVVGLPVELHLRGTDDQTGENKKMSYCGPGTRLNERLNPDDTWKSWSRPINNLDLACYHHDLAYRDHKDPIARNRADDTLSREAIRFEHKPNISWLDRIDVEIVKKAMDLIHR